MSDISDWANEFAANCEAVFKVHQEAMLAEIGGWNESCTVSNELGDLGESCINQNALRSEEVSVVQESEDNKLEAFVRSYMKQKALQDAKEVPIIQESIVESDQLEATEKSTEVESDINQNLQPNQEKWFFNKWVVAAGVATCALGAAIAAYLLGNK